MSTRAQIGIQSGDGVKAVYLHSDGYPSYAGAILKKHYGTAAKAKALLAQGDISILAPKIGKKHAFEDAYKKMQAGVSTFYGRDRDEDGTGPHNFRSVDEWLREYGDDAEFFYLFKKGGWHLSHAGSWQKITASLIKAVEKHAGF